MSPNFLQGLPEQWRGTVAFLISGLSWIPYWQTSVLDFLWSGSTVWEVTAKAVFLVLPALLLIVGVWCTMASLYTLPFRSGRSGFLTTLLLSWWDAGRAMWLFWAGLLRLAVLLVGWTWGVLKTGVQLLARFVRGLVASPFAVLDWGTRTYFQPGVPWIAFVLIVLWSALEATIFTFTLRPTLTEVLADLTGSMPSVAVVGPLLWLFLFVLISGSFACIQLLAEAVAAKQTGQIVQMVFVEFFVMFFEVVFLYRELIDAITPWIAQSTGFQLGFFSTLAMASFGWIGVRAMTWFLFGRFGTPALLSVLARQRIAGAPTETTSLVPVQADLWRAPFTALKAETKWFTNEAQKLFELITLPVLQVFAAAVNFGHVVIMGRPRFQLPFSNFDEVLAATPIPNPPVAQPRSSGAAT